MLNMSTHVSTTQYNAERVIKYVHNTQHNAEHITACLHNTMLNMSMQVLDTIQC